MADKKNQPQSGQEPRADGANELATLRHIVFGAAKADIEQQLKTLTETMHERFNELEAKMAQQFQTQRIETDDALSQLGQQLALVDQSHEQKSAEIQSFADKLASELEMSDTSAKQDNDELHDRLDKEIKLLSDSFTAQLNSALEQLNQVSSELNNNKTDRKTLAKLLSTVASNLEIDQDDQAH
ncbi:MAG: hypothetical protein GW763_15350 [Paraglaciecola sp.]|nr:hypothetical protein [Paraglaciecola sp.]NCT49327.1 hypothetical protein [Paraglaciecola sp.]